MSGRKAKKVDRVVKYQPVNDHKMNVSLIQNRKYVQFTVTAIHLCHIEPHLSSFYCFCPQIDYERKKKEEGKRAREDEEVVKALLFSAFERHQYYNLKDLISITKQPVVRHFHCYKLRKYGRTQ